MNLQLINIVVKSLYYMYTVTDEFLFLILADKMNFATKMSYIFALCTYHNRQAILKTKSLGFFNVILKVTTDSA